MHARTHARTHAHTLTPPPPPHTHTQTSYKDNEEIEAGGLKVVFEQVFYEDSFKRKQNQFTSVSLFAYLTKHF